MIMKSKKVNRKIYLLIIILTGLALGSYIITVKTSPDDFVEEVEQFKDRVSSSPKDCWRWPAKFLKNWMVFKLDRIMDLIFEEKYKWAYMKLLYDVKPKLTGLKTDENEEPWGLCSFYWAWVKCDDLKEEFRIACNALLSHLKLGAEYDDDMTAPSISIVYSGSEFVNDPGKWEILIEDPESGMDEVTIELNGIEEIHDTNLQGVLSLSYDIPVPAIVGINTIVVIATNNDKDFVGDQEISTETEWVELKVPPITIITPEEKTYTEGNGWYFGTYDFESDTVGGDPAGWQVNDFYASEIDIFAFEDDPHQKVIRIKDNEDDWVCETYTYFSSDQTSGTVEWWVMSSDIDGKLKMEFMSNQGYRFDVRIWNHKIMAGGAELIDFEIETWYHIRVDFDCTTHTYNVSINGQLKGKNLEFDPIINTVFCFRLQTEFYTLSGPYYFDALGYSWDDDYSIGDNFRRGLLLSFVTELDLDWIGYSLDSQAPRTILGNTTIPMPDDGSHTIQVFGEDSLGNMYESEIRNFYIDLSVSPITDNSPPIIELDYDGEATTEDPGLWLVNLEDPESGIAEVTITIDGEIYILETNLGGISFKTFDNIPVPNTLGLHVIWIEVKNGAGLIHSIDSGVIIEEPPEDPEPPPIIIL
jgi:hypothetical protein